MNPFRLPVIEAMYATSEIPSLLPTDYTQLSRCGVRCNWNGPELLCVKEGCTNGKHYGIVGNPPHRVAMVWFDAGEEKNDE